MSTPAPTDPAIAPRSAWAAWKGFWFRPADPTTLGFIRICTGLLVLYIQKSEVRRLLSAAKLVSLG